MMSVDDVFTALLERDGMLWVDDGRLRYVGPKLAADDLLLDAIDAHRVVLAEMFTYAPGGRCTFTDCHRLRAEGDRLACPDCRGQMDAIPMPWEAR